MLNNGLAANNRAKYLLSLLQAAPARADAPDQGFASLRDQRLAEAFRVERQDDGRVKITPKVVA